MTYPFVSFARTSFGNAKSIHPTWKEKISILERYSLCYNRPPDRLSAHPRPVGGWSQTKEGSFSRKQEAASRRVSTRPTTPPCRGYRSCGSAGVRHLTSLENHQ